MGSPNISVRCILSDIQCEQFVHEGFVKVESAFDDETATEARGILWRDTGCDPNDPATWTRPVVRVPGHGEEPFRRAATSLRLHAAFDQLVGPGRWLPQNGLGTFPIRFPHPDDPGDAGWHVDVSFPPDAGASGEEATTMDYSKWRVNLHSRGRALLMLFLFSDVEERDAPTRIRVGSHLAVARLLAPAEERGFAATELSLGAEQQSRGLPEAVATGPAGTVYLCHPFLVHAAQPHRGTQPRFLAQPSLEPRRPMQLDHAPGSSSLVEQAIRLALGMER